MDVLGSQPTSTQKGPFVAMSISCSRGTFLIDELFPGERRGGDDIQVGQPEHVHEAAGLLLPPGEAAREVRLAVEAERARQPVSGAVRTPQGHRGCCQV